MGRLLGIVVVVVVTWLAAGCAGDAPGRPATAGQGDPAGDPEVARLRRHFAEVDRELRAADVSRLSPAQRTARAAAIERLRRYAARGVFPHNHDFAVGTPYFIDAHGTRCAMAHLIEEAGGAELVAAVAAHRNNAYLPELAGDPALVAWLDRNGLTAAEAARIQPTYDPCEGRDCTNWVDARTALISLGLTTADGVAIGLNLRDDAGHRAVALGMTAGGLTALVGGVRLALVDDRRKLERAICWADLGIGAVTVAVSLRTLRYGRSPHAAPATTAAGWSLTPMVGPARGVAVRTTF